MKTEHKTQCPRCGYAFKAGHEFRDHQYRCRGRVDGIPRRTAESERFGTLSDALIRATEKTLDTEGA